MHSPTCTAEKCGVARHLSLFHQPNLECYSRMPSQASPYFPAQPHGISLWRTDQSAPDATATMVGRCVCVQTRAPSSCSTGKQCKQTNKQTNTVHENACHTKQAKPAKHMHVPSYPAITLHPPLATCQHNHKIYARTDLLSLIIQTSIIPTPQNTSPSFNLKPLASKTQLVIRSLPTTTRQSVPK